MQIDQHTYIAILAGGVGTRLWPRSRQDQPKQFSHIQNPTRTMIQTTVDRVADLVSADHIYIVTGERYTQMAQQQLPQVPSANILAEPCGRNTAPAIGLSCLHLRRRDPQAVVAALHSDHAIPDVTAFQQALKTAFAIAQGNTDDTNYIVTLGIEPTFPHTGYGYIHCHAQPLPPEAFSEGETPPTPTTAYAVRRFLEKPPLAQAEEFLRTGGYYWNAGMFIFRAQHMLAEIARQLPELYAGLMEIDQALDQGPTQAQAVMARVWPTLPNVSIDHGIMEGTPHVAVVPLDAGWNDVGSWDALAHVIPPQADGNVVAGGKLMALDSHSNIIYAGDKKLVALIGVDDLVVVDTGDAILVGKKDQMQRVKEIVDGLDKSSS
ncbi:MAG: mannose-1-phosphate guanylyltransferase [Litorilinea sp.]